MGEGRRSIGTFTSNPTRTSKDVLLKDFLNQGMQFERYEVGWRYRKRFFWCAYEYTSTTHASGLFHTIFYIVDLWNICKSARPCTPAGTFWSIKLKANKFHIQTERMAAALERLHKEGPFTLTYLKGKWKSLELSLIPCWVLDSKSCYETVNQERGFIFVCHVFVA